MEPSSSTQVEPSPGDGALTAAAPRKKRFHLGLIAKTTLFMLVVGLVPLVLFGAINLMQQGDHLRDQAGQSMQSIAERMAAQVDEWVDKNVRALETAASLPGVMSMQRDEQTRVLTAIRKEYPWMYLVFTIAPGGANVARSDDQPLSSYGDRQYFKDVMTKGHNVAWETLIGKTSKKPALVMAVPIRVDNAIVGVMAAAMNTEDISRIVATWRNGASGFAFLVDETGKLIAHPRQELVLAQRGMQSHPLVSQALADGKPHLASFVDDGTPSLGYVQGNHLHWAVAAQQSSAELMAPLRQSLTLGLWLLAASAVLVLVIALAASRIMVRPIVEMTHAADRMSIGELDTPIRANRADEIGMLAKALDRLRRSMIAAMSRL